MAKPRAHWNVELVASDMASRGWNSSALAKAAGVTPKTIDRFLDGRVQTAKTAKAIAAAFGYKTTQRYLLRVEAVA